MESKTEQDRLREVMEARKTMKKFAKVAYIVGAVAIGLISLIFRSPLIFLIVAAAYVGVGFFLRYSFKASDAQDQKRIDELDANYGMGQGQAAQGMMGTGSDLVREVQGELSALSASASKMENEKEATLEAIATLKEQVVAISKSINEIRKFIAKIDENTTSEIEQQQLADLLSREKAQLEKLQNIGQQAKELKVLLDKSLVAGVAEAGDSAKVEEALRSIKVGAVVNAQMKDLH